jgi:hypothetical protein
MIGDENFTKAFYVPPSKRDDIFEDVLNKERAALFESMAIDTSKAAMTRNAIEHKPLTLEDLQKTMSDIQSQDHFLFIECDYVPDNSKGIILMRKDDMKKMFPEKYKDKT